MSRTAEVRRATGETDVRVRVDLDGSGLAEVATGVGFFDHVLTLLARHSLIDLEVAATGDLETGSHHTVEDVGITL
ncbi:MAG TPA: imidazoleglycerol-phosphate dehydratase, partial [Miltoncostaeaceae bacterium]|nr:imidazoleglycerol-phosphate dehydratase [Miltoncostaeaceae bacterium]